MKKKEINKKLRLNKTTLAGLNQNEMNQIQGGVVTQLATVCAPTCVTRCVATMCLCTKQVPTTCGPS